LRLVVERFSDEARQVVVAARDEARELDDHAIDTTHLLLAIARGSGTAASLLASAGGTVNVICAELGISEAPACARPAPVMTVEQPVIAENFQLPLTRDAVKVLKSAWLEADTLGHTSIEPEHILLGILDVPGGTAFTSLSACGIDPSGLRAKLTSAMARFDAVLKYRARNRP
jgi:ATP-dependent Clp protease ATP-binding subunit ClpC